MPAVLAWCLKNWRLLAYAVAAAVLVWLLLLVRHWRTDSVVELPKAQAALLNEQECGPTSECQKRTVALVARQAEESAKVVKEFNDEITALNARPMPTRVIRVCRDPRSSNVRDASAPPGTGAGTAPAGLVHGADEFDTRPLFDLARRADALSAQARAIIHRDRALAKVP